MLPVISALVACIAGLFRSRASLLWSAKTLCERHAALRYEGVMDYLSFVLEEGDYLSQCLRT